MRFPEHLRLSTVVSFSHLQASSLSASRHESQHALSKQASEIDALEYLSLQIAQAHRAIAHWEVSRGVTSTAPLRPTSDAINSLPPSNTNRSRRRIPLDCVRVFGGSGAAVAAVKSAI